MSKDKIDEIELSEEETEEVEEELLADGELEEDEELECDEEGDEATLSDDEDEEEYELSEEDDEEAELSDDEDEEEYELSEEDDEEDELSDDEDEEEYELSEEDDEEADALEMSDEGDEIELSEEDEEGIEVYDAAERERANKPEFTPLNLISKIEAIIFAAPKCMKVVDILEALGDESLTPEQIKEQIDILVEQYNERQGGFRLESVRGHGYQFRTVPEAAPYMENLFASRPRPLSRAALETLSIVAYRQPVSRADVEFIRGVDSGSIVKNLLERSLIKCVGRNEEVAGRPMIFGTTDEFLAVFRLESLKDLPPITSFQPPQDLMQNADDQLEQMGEGEEREEGDFVGVEGEDGPAVSEGLVGDEMEGAEAVDAVEEGAEFEASEEIEEGEEEREIEGATKLESFEDDAEDLDLAEESDEVEGAFDETTEPEVDHAEASLAEDADEGEEIPEIVAEAELDADEIEQ